LTSALASTTYLTSALASTTYLTSALAATTYLTSALAATTYLTSALAATTYLSITNAASTYLSITNAASTYLSIANAATTYLTQSNANSTYQKIVVGSIIQMPVGIVPPGYLECNGASSSVSTYPALSAVLNFLPYGGSSQSGIFFVPDYRGMFLRGKGQNGIDSNYASSSAYGMMQSDGIKTHTHNIDFGYITTASGGGSQNAYNSTGPSYNNPGTGSGRATGLTSNNANPYPDTRPGNFPILFCIKY